jgi:signal peptidase II
MFVIIFDQLSKRWVDSNLLDSSRIVRVMSFLDLNPAGNHSLAITLYGSKLLELISLAFVIIGLVIFFIVSRWRLHTTSRVAAIGIGLVMGGIISNTVDLLRLGIAIDFLDFHIGAIGITLNPADVAILIGLGFLMLASSIVKQPKRDDTKNKYPL